MPSLSVLDNGDLLLMIFSFLKRQDDLFSLLFVNSTWSSTSSTLFSYGPLVHRLEFANGCLNGLLCAIRIDVEVQLVIEKCPNIKELSFTGMLPPDFFNPVLINNFDHPLANWMETTLEPLKRTEFSQLENFNIVNCNLELLVITKLLEEVSEKCQKISSLSTSLILSEPEARIIVKGFPNLETFRCSSATSDGLNILVAGCRSLKNISAILGQDVQFEEFSKPPQFSQLETLEVSMANHQNFTSLNSVIQPNLRKIVLKSCLSLFDDRLIEIARNCSRLESIALLNCTNITDLSLTALARYRNLKLKKIRLFGLHNISDTSIYEISNNCSMLQNFAVEQCSRTTGRSFLDIISKCQRLRKFSCNATKNIAFILINQIAIVKESSKLQVLRFTECYDIENDAYTFTPQLLENWIQKCPALRKLIIHFLIPEVTPMVIIKNIG
ncbi:hypothetical protein G9A89_009172 [Geosiphon pyriformis]|nr:hypothetical protein G9A89_009172 [Geosiphon pyriformis]